MRPIIQCSRRKPNSDSEKTTVFAGLLQPHALSNPAGDHPAQVWAADGVFDDQYVLALPDDLPFHEVAVMIGLYDTVSGARVPRDGQGERQHADTLVADLLPVNQP